MEITVARKRLEEMRDDLDRSIAILQGERPGAAAGAGYPQDSADAGSALSETDRTEAVLHSARGQRDEVLAALARIEQDTYGRCVDCGGEIPPRPARRASRRGPLRQLPGQALPPPLAPATPARRRLAPAARLAPLARRDQQLGPHRLIGLGGQLGADQAGQAARRRRSTRLTTDSPSMVRGRIDLTVSPAPLNSSRAWSGP